MIAQSVLLTATLPSSANNYLNAKDSEGEIRTAFKNKRGVYLWTNKTNGDQYVGSSQHLSNRLTDYFSGAYIKSQSSRGSIIASAILK